MYSTILVGLLLVPFFLSLVVFLLQRFIGDAKAVVEAIHVASISTVFVLGLAVIVGVLQDGSVWALNDWLHVDALAAIFLLIVSVVGFLVGLYSIGYIRHDLESHELSVRQMMTYYGLFSLFLSTMILVLTANNIILIWVAVEATTLGSTFLVGIYSKRSSLEAAWKYVIICTVGVAFALYGTILVYSDAVNFLQEPGSAVLWTEIVKNATALDPTLLKLAFVFILIGYGTKAGIFPMHAWLPDAHSEAPSPVSAMLSGVLLNCALFVVIRFAIILDVGIGPQFSQTIFLVFGTLSIAAAAFFMFAQRDLKRLLAYSSVENIGLIVLALGVGGPVGVLAALLHCVNHSLAKSLMFCTSGNILMKYHTRDLGKIHGMLQVAPITSMLLIVGALALVGIPPFNIFVSKFLFITAGFATGYVWLMFFSLFILAIVFAAFMRLISSSVFGEKPAEVVRGEIRWMMLVPMTVLVILILVLGVYQPPQYADLMNQAVGIVLTSGPVEQATSLPVLIKPGISLAIQSLMP